MESKKASPAAIVGIIGGVILVIGSFLSWATVSFNLENFAKAVSDALGIQVSASDLSNAGVQTSQSIKGLDADGKITLVAGIIVVIGAVLLIAARNAKVAGSVLVLLGGLGGAGVALYDIVSKNNQIDKAISDLGPSLTRLGLNGDTFKSLFSVSWGIGIYACILGGVVAVIAGIMSFMTKTPESAMPAMTGAPGAGFGAPMGSSTDAPASPPPAAPSTPTSPPPAAPSTPTSPPPAAPSTPTSPPPEPRSTSAPMPSEPPPETPPTEGGSGDTPPA